MHRDRYTSIILCFNRDWNCLPKAFLFLTNNSWWKCSSFSLAGHKKAVWCEAYVIGLPLSKANSGEELVLVYHYGKHDTWFLRRNLCELPLKSKYNTPEKLPFQIFQGRRKMFLFLNWESAASLCLHDLFSVLVWVESPPVNEIEHIITE